jgi:large subunit ribosomal protein L15
MSLLSSLNSIASRKSKRVGRGIGSGKGGHNSGRGSKGQRERTGGKIPLWFEGGHLPLIKRMPMLRGKGKFKVVRPCAEVSLSELNKMSASTVTLETLKLEKVIDKKFKKAKIIGTGTMSQAVTVQGLLVSKSAKEAIEKVGGSVK